MLLHRRRVVRHSWPRTLYPAVILVGRISDLTIFHQVHSHDSGPRSPPSSPRPPPCSCFCFSFIISRIQLGGRSLLLHRECSFLLGIISVITTFSPCSQLRRSSVATGLELSFSCILHMLAMSFLKDPGVRFFIYSWVCGL